MLAAILERTNILELVLAAASQRQGYSGRLRGLAVSCRFRFQKQHMYRRSSERKMGVVVRDGPYQRG